MAAKLPTLICTFSNNGISLPRILMRLQRKTTLLTGWLRMRRLARDRTDRQRSCSSVLFFTSKRIISNDLCASVLSWAKTSQSEQRNMIVDNFRLSVVAYFVVRGVLCDHASNFLR